MKPDLHVPEEVQGAGRMANRTARNAASSRWMTLLARLGYAAKGVVYLIIGWLAVQLAIGAGGKATDQRGAIQTIYEQPFGKFLLVLVVIGLLGFAIWCFLQAWFDTEGKGSDLRLPADRREDVSRLHRHGASRPSVSALRWIKCRRPNKPRSLGRPVN